MPDRRNLKKGRFILVHNLRIDHQERENRGEWSIPVGGCEVEVCSQDTQTISLAPDSLIS